MAAAPAGDRCALRLHRDRSGVDGHRGRTAAVGRSGRDSNGGRRHADAGPRRSHDDFRAPLPRPVRDRGDAGSLPGSRGDMTPLATFGLPEIIAGVMLIALNAYVLTGGADFGGGVWDLLASGPSRDEQRSLIEQSIAPIWEANHVWLIVVVVLLFSAFPPAFGTLGVVLHIPLSLMLVGIVLRGSAFVFRSYGGRAHGRQWGTLFAVTSLITPVILGMIIGAIVSDRVGVASTHVGTS